ncbi:molybdate transport system substrate-binding protein [Tumebacillus sp. BK434]|uniref:molybdate ABC transporter substrate-binding protein n=1 Tax=Tumebacillus sp. BK434 TaxID=2512169 RepID=UPI00104DF998|nr:molybdate ABC transporter substrate-binding protein [Tumebacillus sp. BK434]TCP52896.1 molybdate transport system substrate-binding protein [Tumebacillus sp. BK434]
MKRSRLALVAAAMLLVGCSQAEPAAVKQEEIVLSAAASLSEPLATLKAEFEQEHGDMKVTINLGASGTLQKQIEQGAPADLFWSAGKTQMDALEKQGLLLDGTRRNAAVNQLVLVVKESGPASFQDLANPAVKKVGMGTPETVPAGKYAQEALTHYGIWDAVQPKAVFGKDVKQVLTYVERGDVDAGLVYRSDAHASKQVKIAATAGSDAHSPIVYPLAVLKSSQHQRAAKELLEFLSGDHAQQVLEQNGFAKN